MAETIYAKLEWRTTTNAHTTSENNAIRDHEAHNYFGSGGQYINLDFGNDNFNRHASGHHIWGDSLKNYDPNAANKFDGGGLSLDNDTFNFRNISNITNGAIVNGRIDDFDASRDKIAVEGIEIDLTNPNAHGSNEFSVHIVEYNLLDDEGADPQQYLVIKTNQHTATTSDDGYIFYALAGARIDEDGTGNHDWINDSDKKPSDKHGELHFVELTDLFTLDIENLIANHSVDYVDDQNVIPSGERVSGPGENIVDLDKYIGGTDNQGLNNYFRDVHNIIDPNPMDLFFDRIVGTGYDDAIAAGLNDDEVLAGGGNDKVWAGGGHDTILGEGGNDTLIGNHGNDLFIEENNSGADAFYGGALVKDDNGDYIATDLGNDTVDYSRLSTRVHADLKQDKQNNNSDGAQGDTYHGIENLIGTGYNDYLGGDAADNFLWGGNGDDVVDGRDGDNFLYGGGGNDHLLADGGADTMHGQSGNDVVEGRGGGDELYGGSGADAIYGGGGADVIYGGKDNDTVYGDNGRDTIYLDDGNDIFHDNGQGGWWGRDAVYGGNGNDTLNGGGGKDTLEGGNDHDVISGGGGKDTLDGGSGRDTLTGGDGDDKITGGSWADTFVFASGFGNDTITDFDSSGDKIRFENISGINGFNDLQIQDLGSDVRITIGSNTITLEDVATGSIGADDFIFA